MTSRGAWARLDAAQAAEDSIVNQDRAEWAAADRQDRTEYVRVGGQLMDADDVPARSDVVD